MPPFDNSHYEQACDQAIAMCDGNLRSTIKALIMANEYLEAELTRLQQEHRDLDAAIDALHQSPAPDLLRLQRLKKRKLLLRDRIAFIEDQITPDIIA